MEVPTALTERYTLNAHLARGGMADVYLGQDELLGRKIAVKVLHSQFSNDEAFVKRFRKEAQAAANLTHPNIVGIYDWGQFDSTYFIVMELVDGRSLREVLKSEGALLPRRAVEIASEVSAALSVAHRAGLVHRDIKPGNILLAPDMSVKVTDFGIARAWDDSQELTRTGAVMGTATYFSPEQAQGAPADERSDVYSLGVVLYEMLAGAPPFRGDSPVAVAYQHVSQEALVPSSINPDVSPGLDAIVMKAMNKDPELRYQTAEEMRTDLWRILQGEAPSAMTAVAPVMAMSPGDESETRMMTTPIPPPTVPPDEGYRQLEEPPERGNLAFIVGTFALLVTLGVLLYLVFSQLGGGGSGDGTVVAVPNVVGLTESEALDDLADVGLFGVPRDEASDTVEAGLVIRTEPSANDEVEEGSRVEVIVSAGSETVAVPFVIGVQQADAIALIEGRDLVIGQITTEIDETREPGTVISQNPTPGEEVAAGSSVDIVIATGPDTVTFESLEGLTEQEAIRDLTALGLVAVIDEEFSNTVEEGRVIRTTPEAGVEVPVDGEVTVVVSLGPEPVTVPNLSGLTVDGARSRLAEEGLSLVVNNSTIETEDSQFWDRVIQQSPGEGATLPPGGTVTVTLGSEPPPTTTTTTVPETTTTVPETTTTVPEEEEPPPPEP